MCRVGRHCSPWDLHGPVSFAERILHHLGTLGFGLHGGRSAGLSSGYPWRSSAPPPHFAKSGRRARPHLSPRSFPRRSRSHASEVGQTREPGQPLVVSAFGDCDFLNDVSLPSLCRNSCRPQQEALPALYSCLLRQLRCLQVRRGSSCQALCSKMLIGVRKALDHPAWSTQVLGLIPSV